MCLVPLPGGHGTSDKPSARKKRSCGCILWRSTKNEGAILSSFAVRALDYPGHRWVRRLYLPGGLRQRLARFPKVLCNPQHKLDLVSRVELGVRKALVAG